MSKSHRDLSAIQADIAEQEKAHAKAATSLNKEHVKLEKLRDEHTAARTAGFDETLVKQARDLEINPDNFDSEQALSEAIDRRSQEQTA